MVSIKDYSYYSLRLWDPIFWFGFIKICKAILFLMDIIASSFSGYSFLNGSKEDKDKSTNYETSAHVVKVLGRGTINLIENHDEANFLYLHDSYVHPIMILKQDNIVLKGVNAKYAIFCVTDENICALDTSIGPFAWANMFVAAKKLVFLPIKHFHRLAEESGDPFRSNTKISMIHMTARCGSTLLAKIFEIIPNTRVMSEPNSFLFAWNLYLRGDVSLSEYEKILDSTFRLQCKREKDINRVIIKVPMCATSTLSYLKATYPKLQLLFITRHPLASFRSYDKLWTILPVSGAIGFLTDVNEFRSKNYPIPVNDREWWQMYREALEEGCTLDQQVAITRVFFFNYWCVLDAYLKNKSDYEYNIYYEDLVKTPTEVIKEVFSKLEIPNHHLPDAMKAMKGDSQKGFFKGGYTDKDLPKLIDLMNRKFKEHQVPITVDMPMDEFRLLLDDNNN